MNPLPLLPILAGYALAALGATAAWLMLGLGPVAVMLGVWIGGALLSLAMAAAMRPRAEPAADAAWRRSPAMDQDLAADLLRWEEDRLRDGRVDAPAGAEGKKRA